MTSSGFAAIRRAAKLEIVIAAALGLGALGGAFSAWRNEQHNHQASALFSLAVKDFDEAGQYYSAGNAAITRDQSLFLDYSTAGAAHQRTVARYIFENLMGPTLRAAVSWLHAPANLRSANPARTPFSPGNPYYRVPQIADAQHSTKLSESRFDAARAQQEKADHFMLVEVVLATALFLYGVAGVASSRGLRLLTLGSGLSIFTIAVVLLIVG